MKKFAVFGDPISHSISPRLHNLAIKELNLDAFYGRVCLKDGNLLKETFFNLGLNGANITIPYKQIAFQICDEIDPYAEKIGSLNTIVKNKDKLFGYNTDAPGFLKAINEFKDVKSVLIIGAGGTAKALANALSNLDLEIVNRSDRSLDFKEFNFFTYQNFKPKKFDLVINSTSVGLKDDTLPLPEEILKDCFYKYAFDVIYGRKTPFLNLASSLNIKYKDGLDMLIYQAVLALNLFFNNKLDEKKIEVYMRKAANLN